MLSKRSLNDFIYYACDAVRRQHISDYILKNNAPISMKFGDNLAESMFASPSEKQINAPYL